MQWWLLAYDRHNRRELCRKKCQPQTPGNYDNKAAMSFLNEIVRTLETTHDRIGVRYIYDNKQFNQLAGAQHDKI